VSTSRPTRIAAGCAALLAVAVGAGIPALAQARRIASSREKAAVIAAVRHAGGIGTQQTSSCLRVYVSTVDQRWATMQFVYVPRCEQQDGNGVAVVHRGDGAWRLVTAGSDFSCPIPGHIPQRVQRDLKLGCPT
jgi:hypothetical protein